KLPHQENGRLDWLVTGDALSNRLILQSNQQDRFLEHHADYPHYFQSLEKIKTFKGFIIPAHDRPFHSETLESIRQRIFDVTTLKSDCNN
ncbi:MAG: hypothetical protein MJB14_02240, partial [Spirochaetes bacterium]|nr:hypothetical protein [Spirochaetota bacterium]